MVEFHGFMKIYMCGWMNKPMDVWEFHHHYRNIYICIYLYICINSYKFMYLCIDSWIHISIVLWDFHILCLLHWLLCWLYISKMFSIHSLGVRWRHNLLPLFSCVASLYKFSLLQITFLYHSRKLELIWLVDN